MVKGDSFGPPVGGAMALLKLRMLKLYEGNFQHSAHYRISQHKFGYKNTLSNCYYIRNSKLLQTVNLYHCIRVLHIMQQTFFQYKNNSQKQINL